MPNRSLSTARRYLCKLSVRIRIRAFCFLQDAFFLDFSNPDFDVSDPDFDVSDPDFDVSVVFFLVD